MVFQAQLTYPSPFPYLTQCQVSPQPPLVTEFKRLPRNLGLGQCSTARRLLLLPCFLQSQGLEFLSGKVPGLAGWPQRNVIWVSTGFATSLFKAFMARFNTDIQINYLKSSKEAHQIFLL